MVSRQPSCLGHTRVPWPRDSVHTLVVTELEVSRTALAFLLRLFQLKVLNRHKTQGLQDVSLTLLNSAPSTKLLPSS